MSWVKKITQSAANQKINLQSIHYIIMKGQFQALSLFAILVFYMFPVIQAFAGGPQNQGTPGIYGLVLSDGEGVPFVTVSLKGTTLGTSTDKNGVYVLEDVPPGTHKVIVRGMGYEDLVKEVRFWQDRPRNIDFELVQSTLLMDEVVVSGSRVGVLRYLPGSASTVNSHQLKAQSPMSGNEILRMVSGVNVVDEEGAGLRTNIGIRGLDPDRSRNVLVLEDGIPVALGPYGEPEMYYTPSIDRMSGVEVLKGSGSILYGPQTIGGVVNYLTADPPEQSSGFASFTGGEGAYFSGLAGHGNTYGNLGYQVNYLRRQAENLGPTEFTLNDISGKLMFDVSDRAEVMVKLGYYDENSNSTYLGLTQQMFDHGGEDFTRMAPDDMLAVRRYSLGVQHVFNVSERLQLNTTAYAYTTTRNWKRQDFGYDAYDKQLTGVSWGSGNLPGGTVFMMNSTGNRNRQFEVAGLESRARYNYAIVDRENTLQWGARVLYERAYEQRINGTVAEAASGELRNDEVRTGHAFSAWAQNKLYLNHRLSFTTGLRAEVLDYERDILRSNFEDVNINNTTFLTELIPGAGVNYNLSERIGVFAGIHKGFAPPRLKDAISSSGEDLQLGAEKSWNFELGTRAYLPGAANFELTFFHMDFSNQVIPVSESSGGAGAGYINGGSTLHSGIEAEVVLTLSQWIDMPGELTMGANGTLTESVFSSDRYVKQKTRLEDVEATFVNIKGNKTPYSPGFSSSGFLQYISKRGLGLRVSGNYTGSQYTDVLNTNDTGEWIALAEESPEYAYEQATANGRIGKMDSFFVMDVTAWYELPVGVNLKLSAKNLLNERYIASRRPQGIRVGLPRIINVGLSYSY